MISGEGEIRVRYAYCEECRGVENFEPVIGMGNDVLYECQGYCSQILSGRKLEEINRKNKDALENILVGLKKIYKGKRWDRTITLTRIKEIEAILKQIGNSNYEVASSR